jgi:ADP-dependent NAD(P)H-hydrate dehydratase
MRQAAAKCRLRLVDVANEADAVLLGPGMIDEGAAAELRAGLMSEAGKPVYILDASSFTSLANESETAAAGRARTIVTPHAGEMAKFLRKNTQDIDEPPLAAAQACAGRLRAVVVMKGSDTYVVSPNESEDALFYCRGPIARGTCGSGDVLGGVMAGIAARGADAVRAAARAVYLHGEAGRAWMERRRLRSARALNLPRDTGIDTRS